MAEALARSMASERGLPLEVRSAGIAAAEGFPASPHAQEALAEAGINLRHSSRPLSEEDLKWANLVLTMTMAHKRFLWEQHPDYQDKVFALKEWVDQEGEPENWDVADPFGGDLEIYRQTARELEDLVRRMLDRLFPPQEQKEE